MAIVTPLMKKQMYFDDELNVITNQAHALFKQHFHETVHKNKEFRRTGQRFPDPKDKRSLAYEYRNFNPHKNNIEVPSENRQPLHKPGPNSLCWQTQRANSGGQDDEAADDALQEDFDYRFDLPSDVIDEAEREACEAELAKTGPGRLDSKGHYVLHRRPQSAASLPTRDATLCYAKPASPSARASSPGAKTRMTASWDSALHLQPWGFGAKSVASQRPVSDTKYIGLMGSLAMDGSGSPGHANAGAGSMFGSPASNPRALPSILSPAQSLQGPDNPNRLQGPDNPNRLRGPEQQGKGGGGGGGSGAGILSSIKFMKNRREKVESESLQLYRQVFEEAATMQRKFITCVREANVFAQILGRRVIFRIIERGPAEDAAWGRILQRDNPRLGGATIPSGTGTRIEKMLVEVAEEGRDVRYLGTNHFFREHSRLQVAVNKVLSCRPNMPISDPDEEEARIRAATLAAEEAALAAHRDPHPHAHAHAKLLPPKQAPLDTHPAPAAAAAAAAQPAHLSLRPPRPVIEAKLQEALLMETAKLLRLKAQLECIERLGWNQSIESVRASVGTSY